MQFEAKLTLDGLMTLIAGLMAFAAVIIQIRSSSRQVREQITSQRDAEREEQDRQSRAVAAAILFEIDNVYRLIFDQVNADDFNLRYLIPPNRFVVFEANAGYLGSLGNDLAQAIVRFYGVAARHFLTSQQYLREIENAKADASGHPVSLKGLHAAILQGGYRGVLADSFAAVTDSARAACSRLCDFTGLNRSDIYALSERACTEPKPNAKKN